MFVRQLNLLALSPERLRYAQEDHYRAFTQRSRWVSQQLLGLDEGMNYEARLIEGWRDHFAIMREGVSANCDEPMLAQHGRELYNWILTVAPAQSNLWVRPEFQAAYMVKGSYHMLAEMLRVGWHPHYEIRLQPAPPPIQAKIKTPRKPARTKKRATTQRRSKS
jgi:hypothetical protein